MSGVGEHEVIVVGAGAAGLAAAAALAEDGAKVLVLERRPYVGGRAYSYEHPALGEVVDSQHVLLGCCTNLIELSAKAGAAGKIRWYDEQTFLQPGGPASTIKTSGLPAPLHFAPSFAAASMLGWGDKLGMARGLMEFFRGYPADDRESVAAWLRRTGQTERSIRHFWKPIVMATLNDSVENCSTRYAGQVFHELFVKNSTGGRLGIPTVPLSEFYGDVAGYLGRMGAEVRLRAGVEGMARGADGRWLVRTGEGEYAAKNVVLAIPFEQVQKLMPAVEVSLGERAAKAEILRKTGRFVHSPFTSILLWYDREISELDHAWLLDTTIEWFFHKSRIRRYGPERGSYVELVIAGSKAQLQQTREEILGAALEEFAMFFPEARKARLLKSGILKEARATFSVTPGLERERPGQATGIEGLFVAGDWTETGWPSTMEGGVRSGRLAAGAARGDRLRYLAAELPASGLMRWVSGSRPGLSRG
jgi:squalene-associated FAD-dependent desaturase